MKMNKAIVNSLYIFIALGTVLLIFFFIPRFTHYKKYLFDFLLILYSYPFFALIIFLKKLRWLLIELFVLGVIVSIIVVFFRQIRDIFPPAMIGTSHVIGYAQYYGYPFYLDTIIFFVLLLHPLVVFLFFKLWDQHKKRKLRL